MVLELSSSRSYLLVFLSCFPSSRVSAAANRFLCIGVINDFYFSFKLRRQFYPSSWKLVRLTI